MKYLKNIFYSVYKFLYPDVKLRPDEEKALEIFNLALNNKNNVLILNTDLSGKKYIVPKTYYNNNDTSTCIILDSYSNKISIINHKYKYDISIPSRTCSVMDIMFNNKVQEERDQLEKEILKNTIESLSEVVKNFKTKK